MTDEWPQETSRTKLEVTFGGAMANAIPEVYGSDGPVIPVGGASPATKLTVYHPDERASIVREITDTGRIWVQSVEHGPRDTVIPMTQVGTVLFWRRTT